MFFIFKLPHDMKLLWNNRLTSTAGMCKYKTENGKPVAEIHISTKVCDMPERLRDTCIHEMCHSAVYLFNKLSLFPFMHYYLLLCVI